MQFKKITIGAFALASLALPLLAISQEKIQEEPVKQEMPQAEVKTEEVTTAAPALKPVEKTPVVRPRNYLDGKILSFGASIGGQVEPGMFSAKINADYIFDGIFSLGPSFQGSFGKYGHFLMIFLDGKFRIPVARSLPQLKLDALAGMGYLYRESSGVNFNNFVFHAGMGAEYFVMDSLSLGFEVLSNVTSADTETWFLNLLFGINYYL